MGLGLQRMQGGEAQTAAIELQLGQGADVLGFGPVEADAQTITR